VGDRVKTQKEEFMTRTIGAVCAVVMAVALSGCGTYGAFANVGGGAKVNAETVQGMVEDGRIEEARTYLRGRGLYEADVTERIEQARKAIKEAEARADARAAALAAKENR
jgi:hypothetical protein